MAATGIAGDDMSCASNGGDCGILDELNYDGRSVQLKLKDAPDDGPVAIISLEDWSPLAPSASLPGIGHTRSPPPGDSPPLNVLYCVYLD